MSNLNRVRVRNKIKVPGRRYALSEVISESYQTLYSCKLDSPLYKLTESHINDVKRHPTDLSRLSRNLEILKGLHKLGENAIIKESDCEDEDDILEEDADMETLDDEDVINEDADMETLDDEDVINEDADMETLDDEDVINEDADMETLDDEDVINEDADMETLDDEDVINEEEEVVKDEEITPDELQELKKHLKELRNARRTRECDMHDPQNEEDPERMKMTGKFAESRTWNSEKTSMTKALKNFRESSNKKAFFKSFSKLQPRMKDGKPLSLTESILLYKASNSAMTHLAVELEHNPEFIYTFRECTKMLSHDNEALLECIRQQKSPSKSLVESYRQFSSILLESEDLEDEIMEEDEDVILPDEELPPEEQEMIDPPVDPEPPVEEEVVEENIDDEVLEDELEDEIAPPEEVSEDEDIPPVEEEPVVEEPAVEEPVEEEPLMEEDDDILNSEITDEEAEELRRKLEEIRRGRR